MRGIGVYTVYFPYPSQKFFTGFVQISVALEKSGWFQTHPNPTVALPSEF